MARPLRLNYEGAVYHITARGNARNRVFETKRDRERYLFYLEESLRRYEVHLYLFCLMTNHVHLVLMTPRGNLSAFMQRFHTAYTVWFNRKHRQSGHLFQGRFGASVVEEDEYILKLSRYVHLNPVFVKAHEGKTPKERVSILRAYEWSSYRSYVGLAEQLSFVTYKPVLAMLSMSKARQGAVYRRFVKGGVCDIDAAFVDAKSRSQVCIGSDDCHERVAARYEALASQQEHPEDVAMSQMARRYDVETVLDTTAAVLGISRESLQKRQYNSWQRPLACRALQVYSGLSQREIGKVLSIGSGAAVSKQLRLLGEALKNDCSVCSCWSEISALIES